MIALLVYWLVKLNGIPMLSINNAITQFGLESYDRPSKPGVLPQKILSEAKIGQRAAQCFTLLRLAPMMFQHWINDTDHFIFLHYRYFTEFINVLFMPAMSSSEFLNLLIPNVNTFLQLSRSFSIGWLHDMLGISPQCKIILLPQAII